jgi:hypothetical protein
MIKNHGEEYGLGKYAEQIRETGDGFKVTDKNLRKEILELRKDPKISAFMAAEFTADNRDYLEQAVKGKEVGGTELYLAHFLGAGSAAKFLNAMKRGGNQVAANLFPEEAAANRGVFYDRNDGRALTLKEVYKRFERKFDGSPSVYAAVDTPAVPAVKNAPANLGAIPFDNAAFFMAPRFNNFSNTIAPMQDAPATLQQASAQNMLNELLGPGQRISMYNLIALSAMDHPTDVRGNDKNNDKNKLELLVPHI